MCKVPAALSKSSQGFLPDQFIQEVVMISVKSNSVIEDSDTAEVSNKILSWFFCQGLQVYDLEEQQTALNTLLGLIEKK